MAYKQKSSVDSLCGSPVRAIDPMYNGKKGVQQADFEQFSSAAKMNAQKGDGPVYNLSGKKGLQASNNPAAAYMTGSPVKHKMGGTSGGEVKHSHNETNNSSGKKGFFGQDSGTGIYGPGSFFEPKYMKDQREAVQVKTSKNNNNFVPDNFGEGSETQNSKKTNIGVKSNDGGVTPAVKTPKKPSKPVEKPVVKSSNSNQPPPITQGDAAKLARIKADKNKNTPPPEALTGGDAVRLAKIKEKKKASEPKEMSRKQIREAKKKDKDSGMSRKQVRANKLKRKADSAKAKTNRIIKSIDPTKAKSADTGAKQRKAKSQRAKTIRLEQKAAKFEGKVKASKIK